MSTGIEHSVEYEDTRDPDVVWIGTNFKTKKECINDYKLKSRELGNGSYGFAFRACKSSESNCTSDEEYKYVMKIQPLSSRNPTLSTDINYEIDAYLMFGPLGVTTELVADWKCNSASFRDWEEDDEDEEEEEDSEEEGQEIGWKRTTLYFMVTAPLMHLTLSTFLRQGNVQDSEKRKSLEIFVKHLHTIWKKGWVAFDAKGDNVMVRYSLDQEGEIRLTDVRIVDVGFMGPRDPEAGLWTDDMQKDIRKYNRMDPVKAELKWIRKVSRMYGLWKHYMPKEYVRNYVKNIEAEASTVLFRLR